MSDCKRTERFIWWKSSMENKFSAPLWFYAQSTRRQAKLRREDETLSSICLSGLFGSQGRQGVSGVVLTMLGQNRHFTVGLVLLVCALLQRRSESAPSAAPVTAAGGEAAQRDWRRLAEIVEHVGGMRGHGIARTDAPLTARSRVFPVEQADLSSWRTDRRDQVVGECRAEVWNEPRGVVLHRWGHHVCSLTIAISLLYMKCQTCCKCLGTLGQQRIIAPGGLRCS